MTATKAGLNGEDVVSKLAAMVTLADFGLGMYRRQRCHHKKTYQLLTEALQALAYWRRRPGTNDPDNLTLYRCAHCTAFHLGHENRDEGSDGPRALRPIQPRRRAAKE